MEDESFCKILCPSCGGGIEFPESGLGTQVPCPHCAQAVALVAPPPRADRQETAVTWTTREPEEDVVPGAGTTSQAHGLRKPEGQQLATVSRSFLPVALSGSLVLVVLAIGGLIFLEKTKQKAREDAKIELVASEKRKAREEVRAELVALHVSMRDGVTLAEIRSQKMKLNVVFELRKPQLPSNLSLTRLNLYLGASEYFGGKQTDRSGAALLMFEDDIPWFELVLKVDSPKDQAFLASAKAAVAKGVNFGEKAWDPGFFVKKSFSLSTEEIKMLLGQLD